MKKFLFIFLFSLSLAPVVRAQFLDSNTVEKLNENTGYVQQSAGYDASLTLGQTVAVFIRGFLGLLGIIFIILIVIAGYNWMTAAGNEEKVQKAQETLRRAIIGLLIIIAAYSITYFVFSNLPGSGYGPGTF